MALKIRLTEKQQEIVNLMAAGWKLDISRDAWGGRMKGCACLSLDPSNSTDWRYMSRGITKGLITKGVIVEDGRLDYMTKRYKLTEVGLSLVKE